MSRGPRALLYYLLRDSSPVTACLLDLPWCPPPTTHTCRKKGPEDDKGHCHDDCSCHDKKKHCPGWPFDCPGIHRLRRGHGD